MANKQDKPQVQRVRLKRKLSDPTRMPDQQLQVIASGYGKYTGEVLVGEVVGINSRVISVKFRDDDGYFVEKYLAKAGIRIDDIGDAEGGWRINLSDIDPSKSSSSQEEPKPVLQMLSREEIPYEGDGSDHMVIEVWEEMETQKHYLRASRTGPVGDGALKRPRDLPCVVPFSVLKQLLYDFESEIDDSE